MSHPPRYRARMNPSFRTMKTKKCSVPLALTWSHAGVLYRVTPWPEVQFERLYGDDWIAASPSEDALASASQTCGEPEWRAYLEFVPADVREVLMKFRFSRMEVLQVVARCPELRGAIEETPALAAFLAAHATLRGTQAPAWGQINATFERNGVFGALEWLGLPASRQTLTILHNLTDPEVPKRLLEPLRTLLWEPRTIFALQRISAISDRMLARYCHALAA